MTKDKTIVALETALEAHQNFWEQVQEYEDWPDDVPKILHSHNQTIQRALTALIEHYKGGGEVPNEYQISDDEIDKVWGSANFGSGNKREVILQTLLQIAGGFATGHTAMCICRDLKLLTPKSTPRGGRLTLKGKRVMYYWNKYTRTTALDKLIEVLLDD